MSNPYDGKGIQPTTQGTKATSITPNDSTDLGTVAKALYVGVAGDLRIQSSDGGDITFKNVPVGFFPHFVKRVYTTNTTASEIIAIHD